ncbi:MAG TPA: hypothetical protein VES93_08305 [Ornithinibacter sp.]|nr:hypothetical protein [Ornithinibacter sp.]
MRWVDERHDDVLTAFAEARAREGGAITALRDHLHARLVDELTPLRQRHTIEGLVMGASG